MRRKYIKKYDYPFYHGRCFPIVWRECLLCNYEFKFEIGYWFMDRTGFPFYLCGKCNSSKEEAIRKALEYI